MPIATDMLLVKMLEIAIRLLMKAHQNRHHFAQAQGPSPFSVAHSVPDKRGLPLGLKDLAEVINVTEQLF